MDRPELDLATLKEIAARPPVFIIGCPRSGTTLLQVMLDTHRDLAVTHECDFIIDVAFDPRSHEWSLADQVERALAHPMFGRLGVEAETCRRIVDELRPSDYGAVVRYWFAAKALKDGKRRWGNKTPHMIFHFERVARLFPDAQFIHIIRDGRDSTASWATVHFTQANRGQLLSSALLWRQMVRAGRETGRTLGADRYTEVRLEDLIASTESSLRRLCSFLGLDFDEAMLSYHETATERVPEGQRRVHPDINKPPTSGLRDWKKGLAPADVVAIEGLLRPTLVAFGYEPGPRPDRRAYEAAQIARGLVVGGAAEVWAYRNGLKRELGRRVAALRGGRRVANR